MVKNNSRKGVLAIAFLCLATYVLAFAGEAQALNLDLQFNPNLPGANRVQVEYTGFSQIYDQNSTIPVPDNEWVILFHIVHDFLQTHSSVIVIHPRK